MSVGQGRDGQYAAARAWLRPRRLNRWFGWFFLFFLVLPLIGLIGSDSLGGEAASTVGLISFLLLIPGVLVGALTPLIWVVGMIVLSVRDGRAQKVAAKADSGPPLPPAAVPPELAADIAELERVRAMIAAAARKRLVILLPLAAAAVLGLWFGTDFGASVKGPSWLALILIGCLALFGIWQLVTYGPNLHYAELFKTVTLPRLLARHGPLTYLHGHIPELNELAVHGVLPAFTDVEADDHIHGRYRGHGLFITELRLRHRNFKKKGVLFRGLIVEIATNVIVDNESEHGSREKPVPTFSRHALDRRSRATVAVVMQGQGSSEALEPVRLEDPLFEAVYSVFGSDQIAARALLTPMTMERMLGMSDGTSFDPPRLYAGGRRLVLVLRGANGGDAFESFEPPHLMGADASRQVVALAGELDRIFALVDAIIDATEAAPALFAVS